MILYSYEYTIIGHMPRHLFFFLKYRRVFRFFRIFFMRHYGSKNFKLLLLSQIGFDFFSNFSWISFQWASLFGYLKYWVYGFSRFIKLFLTISAELMKSKFVRRPSVVPLWHRWSLDLLQRFLSNFSCCFPWTISPDVFGILKKKTFLDFLRIFFVFVNMGPYGSRNRRRKFSNLFFLNSLPNCPYKTTFGIFEILKIEILTIFPPFP